MVPLPGNNTIAGDNTETEIGWLPRTEQQENKMEEIEAKLNKLSKSVSNLHKTQMGLILAILDRQIPGNREFQEMQVKLVVLEARMREDHAKFLADLKSAETREQGQVIEDAEKITKGGGEVTAGTEIVAEGEEKHQTNQMDSEKDRIYWDKKVDDRGCEAIESTGSGGKASKIKTTELGRPTIMVPKLPWVTDDIISKKEETDHPLAAVRRICVEYHSLFRWMRKRFQYGETSIRIDTEEEGRYKKRMGSAIVQKESVWRLNLESMGQLGFSSFTHYRIDKNLQRKKATSWANLLGPKKAFQLFQNFRPNHSKLTHHHQSTAHQQKLEPKEFLDGKTKSERMNRALPPSYIPWVEITVRKEKTQFWKDEDSRNQPDRRNSDGRRRPPLSRKVWLLGWWRMEETVPLQTVNRKCSSGLQAVADVAAYIKIGCYDIGIGAGLECMSLEKMSLLSSNNPKIETFPQARDCLLPMGITSENVAQRFDVTREEQDRPAVESNKRVGSATESGIFKEEIITVSTKFVDPKTGEEKQIVVSVDDGIRPNTNLKDLAKLKPAFIKDGSTTAGNASQLSDGAAAVLLMKRSVAKQKRLPVLGVFRTVAAAGVDPSVMGVGPAYAIPDAVKSAGLQLGDIDLFSWPCLCIVEDELKNIEANDQRWWRMEGRFRRFLCSFLHLIREYRLTRGQELGYVLSLEDKTVFDGGGSDRTRDPLGQMLRTKWELVEGENNHVILLPCWRLLAGNRETTTWSMIKRDGSIEGREKKKLVKIGFELGTIDSGNQLVFLSSPWYFSHPLHLFFFSLLVD